MIFSMWLRRSWKDLSIILIEVPHKFSIRRRCQSNLTRLMANSRGFLGTVMDRLQWILMMLPLKTSTQVGGLCARLVSMC